MLSSQQIADRAGKLTASRVACLVGREGETPEQRAKRERQIDQLYREMIGEAEPEDLSHVWPVQLGLVTEQLQLDWFERKNQTPVTKRGWVVVHPKCEWAAATLDGWAYDHP